MKKIFIKKRTAQNNASSFKTTKSRPEGFVILFSIVVSAIVLMISAGVYKIASQEVLLSGTSRESVRAFYAADSGIECALANAELRTAAQLTLTSVLCNGASVPFDQISQRFTVSLENACAQVSVVDTIDANGIARREFLSRGFNTVCENDQPDFGYRSLVERTIRVQFLQGGAGNAGTGGLGGNSGGGGVLLQNATDVLLNTPIGSLQDPNASVPPNINDSAGGGSNAS